jgi:hypothetical protein
MAVRPLETMWHAVLRTDRDELVTYLRSDECRDEDKLEFAAFVDAADEPVIGEIARAMGENLMNGGGYWESIPFAVEKVMPS